jgi:hypothetical protein
MGQSVQIEMRPYPLVRLNTRLWKKCLSSIPEAALPYIPGTRQFQRKCQTQVAQEARKGLQLFKDYKLWILQRSEVCFSKCVPMRTDGQ